MTNIGQEENPLSSFASESSETSETTIVVGIDGRATTPTTPTSMRVDNLRYRTRRRVSLHMNVPQLNDWRMFADFVGFSHLEIRNWERESDPMDTVLSQWIATKVPTLYDFMGVLAQLERFDVIKTLEEETRVASPFTLQERVSQSSDFRDDDVSNNARQLESLTLVASPNLPPPGGGVPSLNTQLPLLSPVSTANSPLLPSNPPESLTIPQLSPVSITSSPLSPLPSNPPALPSNPPSPMVVTVEEEEQSEEEEDVEAKLGRLILNYKTPDEGKFFDVFLSYHENEKDVAFALELDQKCKENSLSACLPFRDLRLGIDQYSAIDYVIQHACKRTVIILSPNYVRSEYKEFETKVAYHLSPAQRRNSLIPVIYRKCKMPSLVSKILHIDYTNELHRPIFWERLIDSLK